MRLALVVTSGLLFLRATAGLCQDTTVAVSATHDSVAPTRLGRIRNRTLALGRSSREVARRTERTIFDTDSAVAQWSRHDDPASRTLRSLSPVAFWVPVVTVTAVPLIWADESQDGHRLNAQYARNAAAALTLGFVASRTTKHFIHRARPCTGREPEDITFRPVADSLPQCPRGSHVSGYSSFFSEHTMALFAIAAAASFQAQRQNAPNAATVTVASFSGASVFSIARIYQRHHWLTDVLVGAAVGTASGFAASQLGPARRRP
jgi:membrane-associated phospholipid phosphatase